MNSIVKYSLDKDMPLNVSSSPCKFKEKILLYLKSFSPVSITGLVTDRITNEWTDIENFDYEDKSYFWNTSEIYHFEKYNLELSEDFIEYVLKRS